MAQQPVELILVRHLASRLAVPVFVIDASGDLVYFNEPAEQALGRRFEETPPMGHDEWTAAFLPSRSGRPLDAEQTPLMIALRQAMPYHTSLDVLTGDDVWRSVEVTAFPIIAPGDRLLGAVAMFWEAHGA